MTSSLSHRPTRRRFIAACGLGVPAIGLLSGLSVEKKKLSVAEAFDREMEAFMQARNVPGGALTVVKGRRLVYARGYGWADREKKSPAQPGSLFRIASVSKPFTAVATLKLAEEQRLDLDAHAFDILKVTPFLAEGKKADARLSRITIRHLLQHTGGW